MSITRFAPFANRIGFPTRTLTPDEAATIAGVIELKRRSIETVEIERRLATLEQKAGEKR